MKRSRVPSSPPPQPVAEPLSPPRMNAIFNLGPDEQPPNVEHAVEMNYKPGSLPRGYVPGQTPLPYFGSLANSFPAGWAPPEHFESADYLALKGYEHALDAHIHQTKKDQEILRRIMTTIAGDDRNNKFSLAVTVLGGRFQYPVEMRQWVLEFLEQIGMDYEVVKAQARASWKRQKEQAEEAAEAARILGKMKLRKDSQAPAGEPSVKADDQADKDNSSDDNEVYVKYPDSPWGPYPEDRALPERPQVNWYDRRIIGETLDKIDVDMEQSPRFYQSTPKDVQTADSARQPPNVYNDKEHYPWKYTNDNGGEASIPSVDDSTGKNSGGDSGDTSGKNSRSISGQSQGNVAGVLDMADTGVRGKKRKHEQMTKKGH